MKCKKIQDLKEKGITLIALVVTIIILLILAGVTLNMALSGDGLFNMARKAATDYNQKSVEEKLQLMYAEKIMEDNDSNSNVKTDVTDVLEEMAGGKITEENIEEFNKLLEQYGEEVKGVTSSSELSKIGKDENYPIDGVYVQLSDIELLTTQIGSKDNPFKGIYNGNGKSIKKLEITANEDYTGMFRVNEGTVKNVTIENYQITSEKGMVGGIAGENIGLIENCTISSGNITSNGQYLTIGGIEEGSRVGGICGQNDYGGTIRNCINNSAIKGAHQFTGGICGYNYGGCIEKCSNGGYVRGLVSVGGIAGCSGFEDRKWDSEVKVSYCSNKGLIVCLEEDKIIKEGNKIDDDYVGGIVGDLRNGSFVENCENDGDVKSGVTDTGGIVGYLREGKVLECLNSGNIQRW